MVVKGKCNGNQSAFLILSGRFLFSNIFFERLDLYLLDLDTFSSVVVVALGCGQQTRRDE